KGRGIGDCGDFSKWVWDGARFQLAESAVMPTCRGIVSDEWPVMWRSKVE
ncbi:MAG: DUF1176 domain-containing protein, partial [Hyphomicrobiales bacterium]|nr:DUF1176 domain-containing protein [Hyphomicrobiales bacterium]